MTKIKIQVGFYDQEDLMEMEVEKGTFIEDVAEQVKDKNPYRILACRKDNRDLRLTHPIEEPCKLIFLDLRDASANLFYQRSISFVYLKAVSDVLGDVKVLIANSLNKGLYTEIKRAEAVTAPELAAVEARMKELIAEDIPFVKEKFTREKALAILGKYSEKARIVENLPAEIEDVTLYSLDGFINFFYGPMVPSTGYVEYFELRKCRRGVLLRFPEQKKPDAIPEFRDDVKLYEAFGEATRWGHLMGITFLEDLNQVVRDGSYKEVIQISEALHEKKVAQIADMIRQQGRHIILIAGPSSSGKTTFAQRLCIQLRVNGYMPLYLSTDDYFVERHETPKDERGEYNFEDLDAIDVNLFNKNMNALLKGEEVDLPTFDFHDGCKKFGKRITKAKKGQPIVIEGIHGLNKKLTEQIPDQEKFKIYISPFTQLNIDLHNRIPTTDARMLRRIVRDSQFRGYSAQHTIKLWPKVRAGEDKNIFPFNSEADVLFNSVHIYELAVLKKYAEPLLEAVRPDEPEYPTAHRLLRFLQYFETIEDDSIIVNNSILREFIGGSIFVD